MSVETKISVILYIQSHYCATPIMRYREFFDNLYKASLKHSNCAVLVDDGFQCTVVKTV